MGQIWETPMYIYLFTLVIDIISSTNMYTLCLPLSGQSIDLLYYELYLLVRKTIIVILSGKHEINCLQHHTCIDFSYNLDIHNMINNMSIVISIHLEIVRKQNATILNAMCIYQFRYDFYNYFFSSRKIIESQLNNVPILFGLYVHIVCHLCLNACHRMVGWSCGICITRFYTIHNLGILFTRCILKYCSGCESIVVGTHGSNTNILILLSSKRKDMRILCLLFITPKIICITVNVFAPFTIRKSQT